ncbi:MAG: hypothetical protein LBU32_27725 [Clostridiales bacterium]|nr:hypothetical protein [Clostridiales bacterium]
MAKKKHLAANILLVILFAVTGNILLYFYKSGENYIYYWDIGGYWIKAMDFTALFFSNRSAALSSLRQSLSSSDYTMLPAVLYVFVFKFISSSNMAFVMATYNIYGIPFMLLFYAFCIRELEISHIAGRFAALLFIFTFTVVLTPLMGGYLDVSGLAVAAVILHLAWRWKFVSISPARIAALAFLTLALAFLRRWYVFWIFSFFISFAAVKALERNLRESAYCLISLFLSGSLWILTLFIFFREFLEKIFSFDYSTAYSAYDFGGLAYSLKFMLSQTGILMAAAIAIGAALLAANRRKRSIALFFILQSLICLLSFTRIQSLGIQHLYLFAPMFLFFGVSFLTELPKLFNKPLARRAAFAFLLALAAANFLSSYVLEAQPALKLAGPLFSQKKMFRRERGDTDEIRRMADSINAWTQGRKYTYALASGDVLNSDILSNCRLPQTRYALKKLLYTYDVDMRDGFPYHFYLADYIVAAQPVPYHLEPGSQRSIGIISDAIFSGKAGDSLKIKGTFELDGGVAAYVYEKVKPYSREFTRLIATEFENAYPGYPFLHENNSIYTRFYDIDMPLGTDILPYRDNFVIAQNCDSGRFKLYLGGQFDEAYLCMENVAASSKTSVLAIGDSGEALLDTGPLELTQRELFTINASGLDFIEFIFNEEQAEGYDISVEIKLK